MDAKILEKINKSMLKSRPEVRVGDTVKLSMKIKETGKERIQIFEGIVISMSGSGMNKTITVRKVSSGIGIERIVPMHSPSLDKIEVVKRGTVRRAKLYYMRDKIGKRAMDVTNAKNVYMTDEEAKAEEDVVAETVVEENVEEVALESVVEEKKEDEVIVDPVSEEKIDEVKEEPKA
jgi:large subunit ribosomal protein L19